MNEDLFYNKYNEKKHIIKNILKKKKFSKRFNK